ncbi:MAG: SpoIIE family protein phosphatase [Lachnospiraceae bacterium]|nr:SpoIIE family protein phosphatase [Lachnospiraceae bacterium]
MKKHLSRIVSNRILAVLIASFAILMAITVIFVFLYAKSRTDNMISFYLDDLRDYTVSAMDRHLRKDTLRYTEYVESLVAEDGKELFTDPEYDAFVESYFLRSLKYNEGEYDEINLVDGNGIIRISTVEDYVGYDMHSGEQSAEFLCLLDGTDVFLQDLKELSYDERSRMRYTGAALKNTKGFLQIGLTEDTYYLKCESYMISRIRDERIGRGGYYLLLDREQKIIGSPRDTYNDDILSLPDDSGKLAESGRIIRCDIYGIDSYVGTMKFNNDIMVVIYPVAEAWETWNVAMLALVAIYVAVFAVLFVFINRLMTKHVVQGVYSLNGSLLKITDGDLNEKADYRESVEFDELSDGINFTVDRLKQLIKEAEERIDAELALAARIQTSFIPHKFPAFPDRKEFELFAEMVPAKEVGGDFYDYFLIDDDHLALVMADVSDKGIPAAMFMVMAKDKIHHSVMKYCTDVSAAIADVNLELLKENDAGLFVTVWLGVVTLSTGHVDYVDAGHEYPAICRAGGKFAVNEDEHSGPVAALKKMKFDAGSFDLRPEDILYLYTDGVTEANDPDGEMFRADKMLDALNADTGASVEEIDANVRRAIDEFVKDAPQFDDTTSLVFRYKGAG